MPLLDTIFDAFDARLTPLHLLTGSTPPHRAPLLLIEAHQREHIAAWADLLHAYQSPAALLLDGHTLGSPGALSWSELALLPGLGLWPVFRGLSGAPMTRLPPAKISSELNSLQQMSSLPLTLLAPHPASPLPIATDALLLAALRPLPIHTVFIPHLQPPSPGAASQQAPHLARMHAVRPEDSHRELLGWLEHAPLRSLRATTRTLGHRLGELLKSRPEAL